MDAVQTAAADTTSDPSPYHRPPHHHFSEPPLAKRQKLDAHSVHHERRLSGLEGGRGGVGGTKGGYRNYSGRVLPVGIAQPFRPEESPATATLEQETECLKEDIECKSSYLKTGIVGRTGDGASSPEGRGSSNWSDHAGGKAGRALENKHLLNALGGALREEDSCDSDQSSVRAPRFNRFDNESTRDGRQNPQQTEDSGSDSSEGAESDSSSNSSSSFEFAFAPPSTSTEGRADTELDGERGQPVATGAETEGEGLTRKPSTSHPVPPPGLPSLPPGKKFHVFVSHSTGDQQWVREAVVVPLREPPHGLQVAACYHFMPNNSRYNDRAIRSSMAESCVVLVGLSPAYLHSQRCALRCCNCL